MNARPHIVTASFDNVSHSMTTFLIRLHMPMSVASSKQVGLHRAFGVPNALHLERINHVADLLELVVGELDLASVDALLDAFRVGL